MPIAHLNHTLPWLDFSSAKGMRSDFISALMVLTMIPHSCWMLAWYLEEQNMQNYQNNLYTIHTEKKK